MGLERWVLSVAESREGEMCFSSSWWWEEGSLSVCWSSPFFLCFRVVARWSKSLPSWDTVQGLGPGRYHFKEDSSVPRNAAKSQNGGALNRQPSPASVFSCCPKSAKRGWTDKLLKRSPLNFKLLKVQLLIFSILTSKCAFRNQAG